MFKQFFKKKEILSLLEVSLRQLNYWSEKGILNPIIFKENSKNKKFYSFDDLCYCYLFSSFKKKGYTSQKIIPLLLNLKELVKNSNRSIANLHVYISFKEGVIISPSFISMSAKIEKRFFRFNCEIVRDIVNKKYPPKGFWELNN
jgi:DNA-binding transcriptional MerR regulator